MGITDRMGRYRRTDLHLHREMTHQGVDTDRQEAHQTGGMAPPAEDGAHLEAAVHQAEGDPPEEVTHYSLTHSESTAEEAQVDHQAVAPQTATATTRVTGMRRGCPAEQDAGIACWTGQASLSGRCVPT